MLGALTCTSSSPAASTTSQQLQLPCTCTCSLQVVARRVGRRGPGLPSRLFASDPGRASHWDPFPSPTLPSDATASYKSALVHVHIMLASLSTPQELEARGTDWAGRLVCGLLGV